MTFKDVKRLGGGGLNRRRLVDHSDQVEFYQEKRRLNGADDTFQFNCVLSETNLEGTSDILINYERCLVPNDSLSIGSTQAIGVGTTKYSEALATARVILPLPIQDSLTTYVRDCDATWTLDGYTHVYIQGNEVGSNCRIVAQGTSLADAVITVDFGTGSCGSGYQVTLNEGSILIGVNEIISFGSSFKNIIFIMSNCNDEVFISKTHGDASSIEIQGADGNDVIELGNADHPLETIFGNIIIDGGKGSDKLTLQDMSSTQSKPNVELRPTTMTGIHGSDDNSISYFGVEASFVNLGSVPANVTVFSTSKDSSLTLTTQDANDVINVVNVKGTLSIFSGDGDDTISAKQTQGEVTITSGVGNHDITCETTSGSIALVLGNGASHSISLAQTEGDISINTGSGNRLITASDTSGSLNATLGGGGDDNITVKRTDGEVRIVTGDGVHTFDVQETAGLFDAEVGDSSSLDSFVLLNTEGSINIRAGIGHHTIKANDTIGNLTATLGGQGNDTITVKRTDGEIRIVTGDGVHTFDVQETAGLFDAKVGQSSSLDSFLLLDTDGTINIEAGQGNHNIVANDTVGNLTATLGGQGNDTVTVKRTDGEIRIKTGDGDHIFDIMNTSGLIEIDAGNCAINTFDLLDTNGTVNLLAGEGNHLITAYNTIGSLNATLGGQGDDTVSIRETVGSIYVLTGNGDHNVTVDETVGSIDLTLGDGSSHLFTITDTEGDIDITVGNGNHYVTIVDTSSGNITINAGSNPLEGIFDIQNTSAESSGNAQDSRRLEAAGSGNVNIFTAGGERTDIDVVDTDGGVTINIGPGPSTMDITSTSGDILIVAQGAGRDIINLIGIGGNIDVKSWDDNDLVTVDHLAGNLFIDAGTGNDTLDIDSLGGEDISLHLFLQLQLYYSNICFLAAQNHRERNCSGWAW